jgi:hypothetical protein
MNELITVANVMILLANLAVFGLSLKLYTELMKDKNMNSRMGKSEPVSQSGLAKPELRRWDSLWKTHAGNIRQLSKLLSVPSDKATLLKAADALEVAAGHIEELEAVTKTP